MLGVGVTAKIGRKGWGLGQARVTGLKRVERWLQVRYFMPVIGGYVGEERD